MRFLFLFWGLVAWGFSLNAQDSHWHTQADGAFARASAQQGLVVAVFAGSDWCRPCIQFKHDILESDAFGAYAASGALTVLYLDFPAKKKNRLPAEAAAHNEAWAERYNQEGKFPKILLFGAGQQPLGEIPFEQQSPEDFLAQVKKLGHAQE